MVYEDTPHETVTKQTNSPNYHPYHLQLQCFMRFFTLIRFLKKPRPDHCICTMGVS